MSATQVIEEIRHLTPAEQAEVIQFAYRLDAERMLSGNELVVLAKKWWQRRTPLRRSRFASRWSADSTAASPMPKIGRTRIPAALLRHLFDRVRERAISEAQLGLLLAWIDANPEVPHGKWFKRFPEMTVCGEGELIKPERRY